MLDLILGMDGDDYIGTRLVDVNLVMAPRTQKWYFIDVLFETLVRCGNGSAFAMDIAHSRGSTALHKASLHGQTHLVKWLLSHGAKKSLGIKNKMGCTPQRSPRCTLSPCGFRGLANAGEWMGTRCRDSVYSQSRHRWDVALGS